MDLRLPRAYSDPQDHNNTSPPPHQIFRLAQCPVSEAPYEIRIRYFLLQETAKQQQRGPAMSVALQKNEKSEIWMMHKWQ